MNNQELTERRDAVEATNGRVFTAVFVKKSGDIREMNCRLKVTKHLRGGDSTTSHIERLVTVFDMQKKEYRNINLETLKEIRFKGESKKFD